MPFVDDQGAVKELATDRADEALGDRVCTWSPYRCLDDGHACAGEDGVEGRAEPSVAVADEEPERAEFWAPTGPGARRRAPVDADIRAWMGADKRDAIAALLAVPRTERVVEQAHSAFVTRLTGEYAAHPPQPLPGVEAASAAPRSAGVRVPLTTGSTGR